MSRSNALTVASITVLLLACLPDAFAQTNVPLWENRGSGPIRDPNGTTRIEFASDGRSLLQSLPDAFRRWDAVSGRLLSVVPYDYRMRVVAGASYSPDGRYILRRHGTYTIQILDSESGRVVDSVQSYPGGTFHFSSDSKAIIETSPNRITFLSVPGLDRVRHIDLENVASSWLAPDSRELLGIDNGIVVQRDALTGAETRRLAGLGGVLRASHALGSESVVGYSGQWLAIWNARTGERTSLMLDRPGNRPPVLLMNNGGRYAVTLSMDYATGDSTMRVWDILERRRIHDFAIAVRFPLQAAAMAPDEKSIVVLEYDGTFTSLDMRTGSVIRRFAQGHPDHGTCVASSRDGRVVVTGSSKGELRAFAVEDGTLQRTLQMEDHAAIRDLDITSDGKIVALSISGGYTQVTRILSLSQGDSVYREVSSVGPLDISPDDRHIAMAGMDGSIGIFELLSGREVKRLSGHAGFVTTVAYSPDGSKLASGGTDLAVAIWDVGTGDALRTFGGHNSSVYDVVFSRDGRQVISIAADRQVIASSVDGVQRVLTTMQDNVHSLGISADGRSILIGGSVMRTLDAASGSITQTFWDPMWLGGGAVYVDKHPSTRTVPTVSSDGDVVAWSVEGTLSVGDDEANQAGVVAPLPADESITITLPSRSNGVCNALLINARGAIRLRLHVTDPRSESMRVDIRQVEAGIYYLVLDANGERSYHKVVIVR